MHKSEFTVNPFTDIISYVDPLWYTGTVLMCGRIRAVSAINSQNIIFG